MEIQNIIIKSEQEYNDLHENVCDNDNNSDGITYSIDIANKDIIISTQIQNPFYISFSKNKLSNMDPREFHSIYKRVFIMCLKSEEMQCYESEYSFIYDTHTTIEKLNELPKYFTLKEAPKKILNSKYISTHSEIVLSEYLKCFNICKTQLGQDEVVSIFTTHTYDELKYYLQLFENRVEISDVQKIVSLNNYLNSDYPERNQNQISQILMMVRESDYWTNKKNCDINMDDEFSKHRSFQERDFHLDKMKSKAVMKIREKAVRIEKDSPNTNDGGGNDDNIDNLNYGLAPNCGNKDTCRDGAIIDISDALRKQKKRTYFATVDTGKLQLNKQSVAKIFETIITEKELYYMYNTLLISKEYCHLVMNNYDVLIKMKPVLLKYLPLYKYLDGYAWLCFIIEESIFRTKTTINSRYVFDIDTANLLNDYPFSTKDIRQNPYLTLLISDRLMKVSDNYMALPYFENYSHYGISSFAEATIKFNIFTTGKSTFNIFDGLPEFSKYYAVTGSVIPACCQKRSPLMDLVVKNSDIMTATEKWRKFFDKYYGTADIDVICMTTSVFSFIDRVGMLKNTVENNLNKLHETKCIELIVEPVRKTMIIVSVDFLIEKLESIREETGKANLVVEQLIQDVDKNYVREYFYNIYYNAKRCNNKTQRLTFAENVVNNSLYEEYFKPAQQDDVRISLYSDGLGGTGGTGGGTASIESDSITELQLSDFGVETSLDKPNKVVLKICESVRFKLRSDKLLHNIEVFRPRSLDPFSTIAKFHFPCVRGALTDTNIYLLPSCITALKTGINIDYKYIASTTDPAIITHKYGSRGFGCIFNNATEKPHINFYTLHNEPYASIFEAKDNKYASNIFGFKDMNHILFRPTCYSSKKDPHDTYNNVVNIPINTNKELRTYYKNKHGCDFDKMGLDMLKFKAISENGVINKLEKWVIDAYYNLMQVD